MSYHVLIVEDDEVQSEIFSSAIMSMVGYKVSFAETGARMIEIINAPDHGVDMIILDLLLPDADGIELLRKINEVFPKIPVIINTAHGDVDKAINALRMGVIDFVEKKDGVKRLQLAVENVRRITNLQKEVLRLKRASDGRITFDDIIGSSKIINKTKEIAQKASLSNIPILINGQSGVGKELFARAIHGNSSREGKPFIAINCGAIPENLVESILFGHEKGSFTGAIQKTIGKFREAEGGTLFLDEVGELKLDIQVKLLRAIQEGEVEPVGSSEIVKTDVRLLSATNIDLSKAVEEGTFREDLYYRLNVFPFCIPSLSERSEDVPELLEYFCQRISISEQCTYSGLTDEVKIALSNYSWPGNIRQLENASYKAVVLSNNYILDIDDFDHILGANKDNKNDDKVEEKNRNQISVINEIDHFKTLAQLEEETIRAALDFYNWQISEVARRLNIGRSTLYRKIEEYNIRNSSNTENNNSFVI